MEEGLTLGTPDDEVSRITNLKPGITLLPCPPRASRSPPMARKGMTVPRILRSPPTHTKWRSIPLLGIWSAAISIAPLTSSSTTGRGRWMGAEVRARECNERTTPALASGAGVAPAAKRTMAPVAQRSGGGNAAQVSYYSGLSRGGSTATKSAANRWRYASSKAGQKIGLADNPGRKGCIRSGASHLHLAVQIWGDARLTTDADLTLPFARDGALPVVALITSRFPSRTADPLSMALQHRMILITASNGVDVDLSLAVPGYEDRLFERAVAYQLEP